MVLATSPRGSAVAGAHVAILGAIDLVGRVRVLAVRQRISTVLVSLVGLRLVRVSTTTSKRAAPTQVTSHVTFIGRGLVAP